MFDVCDIRVETYDPHLYYLCCATQKHSRLGDSDKSALPSTPTIERAPSTCLDSGFGVYEGLHAHYTHKCKVVIRSVTYLASSARGTSRYVYMS